LGGLSLFWVVGTRVVSFKDLKEVAKASALLLEAGDVLGKDLRESTSEVLRYLSKKLEVSLEDLERWAVPGSIVVPFEQDGEVKFLHIFAANGNYGYEVIQGEGSQGCSTFLSLHGYTDPSQVKPFIRVAD